MNTIRAVCIRTVPSRHEVSSRIVMSTFITIEPGRVVIPRSNRGGILLTHGVMDKRAEQVEKEYRRVK